MAAQGGGMVDPNMMAMSQAMLNGFHVSQEQLASLTIEQQKQLLIAAQMQTMHPDMYKRNGVLQ